MSTREIAYSIIDSLSEKQIEGFIAMFSEYLPSGLKNDRKLAAFRSLEGMIEEIPDIDYDKELAEYREERLCAQQ
ncbi:MAG: hypothetical protein HDT43_12620 [Ruminococcaceae bacterium]|nr:hypothetical protein [Oscillospiraceae bacterium]